MQTPPRRLWRSASLLLALSIAFAATPRSSAAAVSAASSERGEPAGSVPIPAKLTRAEVKDIIVAALSAREWGVVTSASADAVIGYLKHRTNEATVTLLISDAKVDLFCVGWAIDKKTGARQKPEQPKGWLNNLRSDITKGFNRTVSKNS